METAMTNLRVLLRHLTPSGLLVGLLIAPTLTARETLMARETAAPTAAAALQAPAGRGAAPAPQITSPEVGADRRVTFRILAPEAQKVELRSPGDIPGIGGRGVAPPQLTRN